MKMADLLHSIADMLDHAEGGEQVSAVEIPQGHHPKVVDVDHTDGAESNVMLPPLQAKLELLKKSVGVDNAYDGGDELSDIRKLSGMTAMQHEASEDNDIVG
jgi:hypothetical protein